jgi:cell division protein FtsN
MAEDQNSQNRMGNPADRGMPNSGQGTDPLAELARLIGQNDPFSEFGRDPRTAVPAQQPRPSPNEQFAPQYPEMREQAAAQPPFQGQQPHQELPSFIHAPQDSSAYRDAVMRDGSHVSSSEGFYDDGEDRGPSRKFLTATAVIVLALVGTVGAFGYRYIFGGSGSGTPPPIIRANNEPAKVPPPAVGESPSKSTYDRVGDRGQSQRVVGREEAPVDVKDIARPGAGRNPPPPESPMSQWNTAAAPNLPPTGPAVGAPPAMGEPKKVRTVTIRPNSNDANNAPSSLAPPTVAAAPPAPQQRAAPPPPQQRAAPPPQQVQQRAAPAQQSAPAQQQVQQQPQQRAPAPITQSAPPPPANAPLSLNEDSILTLPRSLNEPRPAPQPRQTVQRQAPAPRTEAPPPPQPQALAQAGARGGGYLVQVSSQRSEADAQAALRSLQAKFPNVLRGQPSTVRRAELGERGVFFRAMVGPYGSRDQAAQLCSSLKAAGGDCIVQGN